MGEGSPVDKGGVPLDRGGEGSPVERGGGGVPGR